MNQRLRRALPDLAIIALLLIVPLTLFFPQTIGGQTLIPADNLYQWQPYRALAAEMGVGTPHNALLSDLVLQNLAWKQFARQQIAAGDLPLWQPNILAGSPFLAAGQSSVLYPFSVLFLIPGLPLPAAYGWFTVSQLWLAGITMLILVRVLGMGRPGALVAALAHQLSAFFVASAVFPMIIATAAWLPLELAAVELIVRQCPVAGRPASMPWAAIGAVGLGMAALAGHVEALYFTLLVMGFFAAWRLLAEGIARRGQPGTRRFVATRAAWLGMMVAAGLALGAVQIVPAYELASRSFREGGVTLAQVLGYAYHPRRVLAFLMPDFFGNPAHHTYFDLFTWRTTPITANSFGQGITSTAWDAKNYVEGAAYTGILPLALALIAAMHWLVSQAIRLRRPHEVPPPPGAEGAGRPYRAIFMALALLSLSFAFGLPTYALLYYGLPFINQSHAPFRWVWPLMVCVAVLAGFGVEIIASAPPISRADRPRRTLLPLAARLAMFVGGRSLSLGVLIVLGVVTSRAAYRAIEGIVQQVFDALAGAAYAFPDARAFYSYQARNALLLALMLTLAGAALLASRSGRRVGGIPVWQGLAALAVIVDLGIAGWGFSPAADPALLEVTPPSIAWLKARYDPLEPWRLAVYEEPGSDTLNANMAWLHGLEDIAGYDSLIPGQYADYMRAIMPQDDLPYNRIAPVYAQHAAALDSPLLDLLGVRYVVSEAEIDSPRYTLAYQDDAVRIYENGEALPRAFTLPVTSTVISAADNPAEGFRLLAQQFDFRRYVVVNIHQSPFTAPPADPPIASDPGPAAITVSTAQEMWIDVEVGAESWLIVTASHFPGWRAWVRPLGAGEADEQEIAVYPVNGNFRGMVLPPGRWTVRTKFSPDTFKAGAFASFLTGLALLFALGVWAWRLIYREEPGSAGIRRVAKNTLTPILLNLFNKGILFVLTFAQLRILGPSGAGDYRYAVVIWGWFEIFSNFGLNTFLIREVARHKDEASRYLAATTLLRLVLAALGIPVLAGFLAARQALVADPLDTATLWATGLLYSGLFFSTISTGLTALFYAHEKAEHPAAVQTVSAFLTTTLGIGALLLGWGIVGLAAVSVVVNAITLGILGVLAVRLFFPHRPALSASLRQGFDRALQRTALGESFPLMLNHLLATLFFRIAVVLLEAIQGSAVVGWYGVVYTWVDAIGIIPAFFTLSLFPVMSRQATDDRPALRQTYLLAIKLMTLLSVPTAIFTTLLAPFLVNVLGGSQYLPHGAIALQVFIWAMTFGWINSVTQYVIIALNRQRTLTVAFLVVSAFNIAANVLLIPRYSYLASAVIAILSEFVLWGLFYVVILSELGRVSWAAALGRVALAGIAAGAATLALAQVSTWLALVVGAAIYAAAALAVRPFNADERRLLAPALPGPLRRWMAGPAEG